MGLDLTLMPIDALFREQHRGKSSCWGFSHTLLQLRRTSFDHIVKLHETAEFLPEGHDISGHAARAIPDGKLEGEPAYGTFTTDPYGTRVKWVRAGDLKPLLEQSHHGAPATAYINALDDDHLVILWWH